MSAPRFGGLRWRVSIAVLVVTAVLYSVLAVLLFLVVVDTGRNAVEQRVDDVLDQMESDLAAGSATVRAETADGIVVRLVPVGDEPRALAGQLVVTRPVQLADGAGSLVGTASLRSLNDSLRPLHRALWLGVPLAALFTALIAGIATSRALRPVDEITRLAALIGPDAAERVPVPDSADEIRRLAVTVNEMLDRIAEGRRAMERFTSDASHELRTPLMALHGELELTARGLGDTGSVARMQAQTDRLAELVDDLVLLSTLDEGRPARHLAVDLLAVVAREAATAAPDATVTGTPVEVDGDPALIGRAVRNLLANARRHAADRVDVVVESGGDTATVHVDDDGSGIDAELAPRLFDRFVRLDEARSTDAGGSGLGLAIVASVARAHAGKVSVGRSPLGGARFSLTLPTRPNG